MSWHISHHYSYELHDLNVIFPTNTCGVYWKRENSHRYFFSSEIRRFCVVWKTGKNKYIIAFSEDIILTFRPLGLPIFTKKPSSLVSKMESATIQETCQAEGYPPPKLTWIRLVSPLPVGKTDVKEGRLTIRKLRPVDSGLYQCVATNSLGTKTATMNLIVQSRPLGLYSARYADLYIMIKHFTERLALHHV